jgi:hypothetical protein
MFFPLKNCNLMLTQNITQSYFENVIKIIEYEFIPLTTMYSIELHYLLAAVWYIHYTLKCFSHFQPSYFLVLTMCASLFSNVNQQQKKKNEIKKKELPA